MRSYPILTPSNTETAMKTTSLMLSLSALTGVHAGAAHAQTGSGPPVPVGYHKCTACHSEDPTLCDERWCPPNTGCGKAQGQTSDGTLWVMVVCVIIA